MAVPADQYKTSSPSSMLSSRLLLPEPRVLNPPEKIRPISLPLRTIMVSMVALNPERMVVSKWYRPGTGLVNLPACRIKT